MSARSRLQLAQPVVMQFTLPQIAGKYSFWMYSLLALAALSLLQGQSEPRAKGMMCNGDGTLCMKAAAGQQPVVENPLYFEVQVRSPEPVELAWELLDSAGKILDQDARGELAFLVKKASAKGRTLAVRDFALLPATTGDGKLVLHATSYTMGGERHALPELSIPLRLDQGTTSVSYAMPADNKQFKQAVIESVESDPPGSTPMRAGVVWRTTTLLRVQPAVLGGAAAEAVTRAYRGQCTWHVVNYNQAQGTAHLTTFGSAWAGVTYYLTGLDYLLEKTVERQPGVQRVVFERPPDFGN